jgi:hypothetical protein
MMFFSGSRYQNQTTYTTTLADGTTATAVRLPLPSNPPLLGFHKRQQGERLDLIANYYLGDATGTWQICDGNNALAPDALAIRPLIGVPKKGT